MPAVAVPFISEQPALAGLDAEMSKDVRLGDLSWDLHIAAEEHERTLFGEVRVPTAVVFGIAAPNPISIQRKLLVPLTVLHLNGSGSTPCREAWVYNRARTEVVENLQLPIRAYDPGHEFALRAGMNDDQLAADFRRVTAAVSAHRGLEITLEHFLLATTRSDLSRGLIDATICLESLIPSQDEVIFRFSHQIGRVVSDGPQTLSEAQDMLRKLYSYRSKHVHGNRDSKYAELQKNLWENWEHLEDLMKVCVTYALDFHAQNPERRAWKDHIDSLMLGTGQRLSPEWGTTI